MGSAVVYYSLQGNSALVAKTLADKLGARLVELREIKHRKMGPSIFMKAGFQASLGVKSKLEGQPWKDVDGCDELHLVTPIWASKPVPVMNTFLAECDFNGRAVTVYTVQADPAANATAAREVMANAVRKKGGAVKAARGLVGAGPGKGVNAELAREICEAMPNNL